MDSKKPKRERRDASIPAIRVRRKTRLAIKYVTDHSPDTAVSWQLLAYSAYDGGKETPYGLLGDVIAEELKR